MMRHSTQTLLIGASPTITAVREEVAFAARSSAKVLVTGETGVGKEVVARLIHGWSPRKDRLLTSVNCAGLPDTLLESELFGHARGSFTGAYRDKPGLLESAANGTVFLDEVGEMSSRMQAVLLRFLETGELQRVGADRAHTRVDVRLVAATNRDLAARVAEGAFREDLYYRLNVIRIHLPPLRERREDVPELLRHFLEVCSSEHRVARPTMTQAAIDWLAGYRWPGNVRQLKNLVERLLLKAEGGTIDLDDLPRDLYAPQSEASRASGAGHADVGVDPSPGLVAQMIDGRESFWTAVYPAFMNRDITRETLRRIISHGLQRSAGNYRLVLELFNMPAADYKRFLGFLNKHECKVPFRSFRIVTQPAELPGPEYPRAVGM